MQQQHRLRAALEQMQPEGRLVDRRADRQQAVVLQDQRLARPEDAQKRRDSAAVVDGAREVVEDGVVAVEGAVVLADGLDRATGRGPGAAEGRVRVDGGDDVVAAGVQLGVDREGGGVQRAFALDDVAVEVDLQEIRGLDASPGDAERIRPEAIAVDGVAHGDVAGDPVVVAVFREDPTGAGEPRLAMGALGVGAVEGRGLDARVGPFVELAAVQHVGLCLLHRLLSCSRLSTPEALQC